MAEINHFSVYYLFNPPNRASYKGACFIKAPFKEKSKTSGNQQINTTYKKTIHSQYLHNTSSNFYNKFAAH